MLDGEASSVLTSDTHSQGSNPSECGCHSAPPVQSWYVACTGNRQEVLARDSVQAIGLSAFLPMCWEGLGQNRVRVPLFPGYLFVLFNLVADDWRALYRRPGIRLILGHDPYKPAAVPAKAVEALMRAASKAQVVERPVQALLRAGMRVRVGDRHPWLPGRLGRVVATNSKVALLHLDGLAIPMRVSMQDLEELPA